VEKNKRKTKKRGGKNRNVDTRRKRFQTRPRGCYVLRSDHGRPSAASVEKKEKPSEKKYGQAQNPKTRGTEGDLKGNFEGKDQ